MADYHAVLKRAIDGLPDNTGAARRAVYQRARQAIVNQLKSYKPPLSPSDITAEQLRLEEAIRKVEADAARASLGLSSQPRPATPPARPCAPAPAPSSAPVQPQAPSGAPSGAPAPAASDANAPASNGVGAHAAGSGNGKPGGAQAEGAAPSAKAVNGEPAGKPETAKPAAPAPVHEPVGEAAGGSGFSAADPGASDLDGPDASVVRGPRFEPAPGGDANGAADKAAAAPSDKSAGKSSGKPSDHASDKDAGKRDAIADIDAMTRGAQGAAGQDPYAQADLKPSRLPTIAAAVGGFVVIVALITFAYTQGDTLLAMFESSDEPVAADAGGPAATTSSGGESSKDTARLLSDDGSPAAPDARAVTTTRVVPPAADDGMTIAPQGGETEIAQDGEPAPVADAPAAATGTETDTTATAQPTPVAQRAILYEESADASSGGSAEQGRVLWSTAQETPSGGGAPDTVIKASIAIPERNVTVNLTIRPNRDDTLPASHLIELQFLLPEKFAGKGVSSVPGLIMKTTEEARGDALIGASVRVAEGFFWVALSSIEAERERNITLLRDRGWIDIPVLYESGKRAILTLEKGSPGERVVQTALDAWAAQ
ncbi:hypothetical protein [Breoghania sp.]|uniref:hypothetical protein n=1 Tax=Breoghania sp. TaxID=2065378 RepID=UPI002AA73AB2|nr:hypothetical protein [Breoghania sp.]